MCGSGSVFRIWIRIQKAPEYRSNMDMDPDPQHCLCQGLYFQRITVDKTAECLTLPWSLFPEDNSGQDS